MDDILQSVTDGNVTQLSYYLRLFEEGLIILKSFIDIAPHSSGMELTQVMKSSIMAPEFVLYRWLLTL